MYVAQSGDPLKSKVFHLNTSIVDANQASEWGKKEDLIHFEGGVFLGVSISKLSITHIGLQRFHNSHGLTKTGQENIGKASSVVLVSPAIFGW